MQRNFICSHWIGKAGAFLPSSFCCAVLVSLVNILSPCEAANVTRGITRVGGACMVCCQFFQSLHLLLKSGESNQLRTSKDITTQAGPVGSSACVPALIVNLVGWLNGGTMQIGKYTQKRYVVTCLLSSFGE